MRLGGVLSLLPTLRIVYQVVEINNHCDYCVSVWLLRACVCVCVVKAQQFIFEFITYLNINFSLFRFFFQYILNLSPWGVGGGDVGGDYGIFIYPLKKKRKRRQERGGGGDVQSADQCPAGRIYSVTFTFSFLSIILSVVVGRTRSVLFERDKTAFSSSVTDTQTHMREMLIPHTHTKPLHNIKDWRSTHTQRLRVLLCTDSTISST